MDGHCLLPMINHEVSTSSCIWEVGEVGGEGKVEWRGNCLLTVKSLSSEKLVEVVRGRASFVSLGRGRRWDKLMEVVLCVPKMG